MINRRSLVAAAPALVAFPAVAFALPDAKPLTLPLCLSDDETWTPTILGPIDSAELAAFQSALESVSSTWKSSHSLIRPSTRETTWKEVQQTPGMRAKRVPVSSNPIDQPYPAEIAFRWFLNSINAEDGRFVSTWVPRLEWGGEHRRSVITDYYTRISFAIVQSEAYPGECKHPFMYSIMASWLSS